MGNDASRGRMRNDWLFVPNLDYLEFLHGQHVLNPWARNLNSEFFDDLDNASIVDSGAVALDNESADELLSLHGLINAYRSWGHLQAKINPLENINKMPEYQPLCIENYKVRSGRIFKMNGLLGFEDNASIEEIASFLQKIYCGTAAYEFMHMASEEQRDWIIRRLEKPQHITCFTSEQQKAILKYLLESEQFEDFLHVRYPGAKRFSLQGAESMIVAIEEIILDGVKAGFKEIVIGMPHRGRLSVLTNITGKSFVDIFAGFKGKVPHFDLSHLAGDVKYHLGHSSNRNIDGELLHISLCPNPSHLEAVNPVLLGKVYAKRMLKYNGEFGKVRGILLHGDAAFAGQGVVFESMVVGGVPGYDSGGIVHIVVNNQVGFTTDSPINRPVPHPTFMAKSLDVPVFHVNGDDPEMVHFVSHLASEFSRVFKKDSVINLVCYRKYGHNESDEPRFTQPAMYYEIDKHSSTADIYAQALISKGVINEAHYSKLKNDFKSVLEEAFSATGNINSDSKKKTKLTFKGSWAGYDIPAVGNFFTSALNVQILKPLTEKYLKDLSNKVNTWPSDFSIHDKVMKLYKAREDAIVAGNGIDWGNAEILAFATLVDSGIKVRLSGQDCCRGTFSQRHALIVDQKNETMLSPIQQLREESFFEVINSPLSEYAILGFEYGYSLVEPKSLVLWEAQFGDFANGAQIIIDQFLAASETKWFRCSGLVLLLPHGYEGQGPEHSSARLERFLQLCAEDNMQIANCTTPANYFHLLRRQIQLPFRKPLIVFTPKSLLRHRLASSTLAELVDHEGFKAVIWEKDTAKKGLRKIIFCSGKIYYDLLVARTESSISGISIVRIEQLYPFPESEIKKCLAALMKQSENIQLVWCQEEPKNMGGWLFIRDLLMEAARSSQYAGEIKYVGREAAASTASGYLGVHVEQQKKLINEALE